MIPDWVAGYVGIPFLDKGVDRDGLNCWGLVRLVLMDQFGLVLPTYADAYETSLDKDSVSSAFLDVSQREWVQIDPAIENIKAGDVPLFRLRGLPTHVGIVVAPGIMLHAQEGTFSVLSRYDGMEWGRRIAGIFRHKNLILHAG